MIVTERMGSSYLNMEETGGEAGKTGKKRYNWEYFRKNFRLDDARGVLVNAWEKMVRESGTVGNEQLVLQGRVWNWSYMDSWFENPEVGRGFAVIMQMRVGAWDSGERIRKKKLTCPCCGKAGQETLWHYVVECSRWKKEREEMVRVYLGSGEDATVQVVVDQDKLTKMLERVIGIMDWSAVSQNTPKDVIDRQMSAPMLVKSVHAKRCNQGLAMVMRCAKGVNIDVQIGDKTAKRGRRITKRGARKRRNVSEGNPRKELVTMWSGNETIITKYNSQKKNLNIQNTSFQEQHEGRRIRQRG